MRVLVKCGLHGECLGVRKGVSSYCLLCLHELTPRLRTRFYVDTNMPMRLQLDMEYLISLIDHDTIGIWKRRYAMHM